MESPQLRQVAGSEKPRATRSDPATDLRRVGWLPRDSFCALAHSTTPVQCEEQAEEPTARKSFLSPGPSAPDTPEPDPQDTASSIGALTLQSSACAEPGREVTGQCVCQMPCWQPRISAAVSQCNLHMVY